MSTRRILVIAGSDSSGGAGLEADQKVIAAHGCYAMTATTALTAQNTKGVYDIHRTPPEFLQKQIDACIEDIGVDVVKTGMLASADGVRVVANSLRRHNVQISVVDPVMISTSGSHLLPNDAVQTLIQELFPLTTVLTPNIPEAKLLLQTAGVQFQEPEDVEGIVALAKALQKLGPKYVLLKGGHLPFTKERMVARTEEEQALVLNVVYGEDKLMVVESDYLQSRNTHGTGCSLASAIACNLAQGLAMDKAVTKANKYVEAGIRTSTDIGKGSGPINHFHSTYTLPFASGDFIEYLLERDDVRDAWKEYTEHPFVQQLADGTLPEECFKYYLIQDYLFIIQFARANALAAYKSKTMADIGRTAQQIVNIQDEIKLHVGVCNEYGLSVADIESHEEDQACTAYTRYVLDVGQSEDWLALEIAMLPCLIGYGRIARRLYNDPKTSRDSRYWAWIESYVGEEYAAAMTLGEDLVEKAAAKQSVYRIDELAKIFIHATKMETGFWDMGLRAGKAPL